MSSPTVRQAARGCLESPAWPSSIPYVETFNRAPDPADVRDAFSTVYFSPTDTSRISLGMNEFEERGEIEVVVFASRGRAFADIEAAVYAIRPVILGHLWPSSITILSVDAGEVVSPGGDGLHVEARVAVPYVYYHTGGT
jgi:hypothetical protein